ncbi:MAG: NAD(P)H-dependent oxidoreductase subunit E, partial [Spirochaetaceae bacterium]|nr:NAD(P)H-dependent oxidoreductase subunit E [Spirochaetaceae bacterium]
MATTIQPKNPTIDQLIERYKGKPGALLGLLETVQELEKFRYIPEETLKKISEGMDIPLAQIYSVATFYSFFNLEPQGLHSVVVCR